MVNKIIHQIVGPRADKLINVCLHSWEVLVNYGFEIKTWNDDLIEEFISNLYPFAFPAILNAKNHAEKSDITRYLIIYHFGGYYMDWDIEMINSNRFLDICNKAPKGFLVIDPFNETLASECFSALSGEPYLLSLSQDIIELYNNDLQKYLPTPQYSGPYRMRDSLKRHRNSSQKFIEVNDIFVYNYREIRERPKRKCNSPLIHYWLHSWL